MGINRITINIGTTDDGIEGLGDLNVFDKGDSINGVGIGGNIILILTGVSGISMPVVGNNNGFEGKRSSCK